MFQGFDLHNQIGLKSSQPLDLSMVTSCHRDMSIAKIGMGIQPEDEDTTELRTCI